MDLSRRISCLQVGLTPLPSLSIPKSLIEAIEPQVRSFYRSTEIYPFAPEAADYLCGLATRYACWTLPTRLQSDLGAVEAYSVWLALVWLIDALFDQARSLTTKEDSDDLLLTIMSLDQIEGRTPLLTALFKTTRQAQLRYLLLISEYRRHNREAYDQILVWFTRYLATLTDSAKPLDYSHWRLESGAMMCVVWHLFLFAGASDLGSATLFEMVSLVVSYHNDLLSFHRDRDQETANLIDSFEGDDWSRMRGGIDLVDQLYEEIGEALEETDSELNAEIALAILEGSYNWALNEPRYSYGLKILAAVESGDQELFEELLKKRE